MKNYDTDIDYCYKKHEDCKRTKQNSGFRQNSGIHKKLFVTCKQNAPKEITESTKKLQTNKKKKPAETITESFRPVRLERVNAWLSSLLAR